MIEWPTVTPDDIEWACTVLGLPHTAFSGSDGSDPRGQILRSLDPLDVEACPGSGKTTLLTAKLAILARQWESRRQGICVLSHTNAARREIESKLGATPEGQRLLAYPHFLGTIHGFVNEFLALPWLRSKGVAIELIDDDICLNWRWHQLKPRARSALEKKWKTRQNLRYQDSTFDLGDISWARGGTLGRDTDTYRDMRRVCYESFRAGYFCHEEMFVWANDLMERVPSVSRYIRERFPLLFLDEVQDNSERQSECLHRTFIDGGAATIRQRFGDANQSIYQFQGQPGAETDAFPNTRLRTDIANSFRFGQAIADLADPLAVQRQGLCGQRAERSDLDRETDWYGRNTIFLFREHAIKEVLPAYAEDLASQFTEEEIEAADFTAVGAVHKSDREDNVPRHVGQYWPRYDPELVVGNMKPNSFVRHVHLGRELFTSTGEAYPAVEQVAEAVLRLAARAGANVGAVNRKRKHRYVRELLSGDASILGEYTDLVQELIIDRLPLNESVWRDEYVERVEGLGKAMAEQEALVDAAQEFLTWADDVEGEAAQCEGSNDNVFRHSTERGEVQIRVGSIHSVKGETHTTTLVLDTFFHGHHLKSIKNWILGRRTGGDGVGPRMLMRLRLHYVAMTRASRVVYLAMRYDAFTAEERRALEEQGWRVVVVGDYGAET